MNKPILREKVSEDIIVQINLAGKRFKRRIVGQDFSDKEDHFFMQTAGGERRRPFPSPGHHSARFALRYFSHLTPFFHC